MKMDYVFMIYFAMLFINFYNDRVDVVQLENDEVVIAIPL